MDRKFCILFMAAGFLTAALLFVRFVLAGEKPALELSLSVSHPIAYPGQIVTITGLLKNNTESRQRCRVWYRLEGPDAKVLLFGSIPKLIGPWETVSGSHDKLVQNNPGATYTLVVWVSIDNKTVDTKRVKITVRSARRYNGGIVCGTGE